MQLDMSGIDLDAGVTRTVVVAYLSRETTLRAAYFQQELATDGDKTVKLRNLTDGVDVSAAVQVAGAGAGATIQLTGLFTGTIPIGKVLGLVYTVNAAGAVHPGECSLSISYDPQLGLGSGPAWAG